MNLTFATPPTHEAPSREWLWHSLYEAAELEHTLMCSYLYAAFTLKSKDEGLSNAALDAVTRWRREIIRVAIEEMSHLVSIWNITIAIGGVPRFGRANFPIGVGLLPASIVVKLAPFTPETLQHFVFLERPEHSSEIEGKGFASETVFTRSLAEKRLTPIGSDYKTVGEFYSTLGAQLKQFVAAHGEANAFCGDPALQFTSADIDLPGVQKVLCLKTALAALDAIVLQGEGASEEHSDSHYCRFVRIRDEWQALSKADATFHPAHPAATNPVLRRPPMPEGRVWIESGDAALTVDIANTCYSLMLRMLATAYLLPNTSDARADLLAISVSLMRVMTLFAEQAARMPAGASNPNCNAGMSFTALRDTSPIDHLPSAKHFFVERLAEIQSAAATLQQSIGAPRIENAITLLNALKAKLEKTSLHTTPQSLASLASLASTNVAANVADVTTPTPATTESNVENGIETAHGKTLDLHFEAKRCIHARFCVTGAPKVFLANVKGPWLHPDEIDADRLVEIAHACPSGAITYTPKDDRAMESAPPVNLVSVRESGPYAVKAQIVLNDEAIGFRATLCRCGASKNKPFCDGSHHDIHFNASGEPETGLGGRSVDMLDVRDGALRVETETNGPLHVRGNMEVLAGTGRMVCRLQNATLCRCGGSATKPFCDGTHAKNGFQAA